VNAASAERKASGNRLEGGEDHSHDYLNPKFEARNSKQIQINKFQ